MTKVYIVGGATIDLFGVPSQALKKYDSNPGKLQTSFGGVARNIAENLVRMGVPVTLITAIGNDAYGRELIKHCQSIGIDMTSTLILEEERTACYLAILDHQLDMHIAISDMSILQRIDIPYLKQVFSNIKKEDVLFLDTNFDRAIIEWMLRHAPCPVFVDPISSSKADKLKGLYSMIHTFKPNLQEAETLGGVAVQNKDDLRKLGRVFVDQGIKQVYISLGKAGSFGCTATEAVHIVVEDIAMQNATGAGDALMAGLIHQHLNQCSLRDSLQYAMAAAVRTVESEHSVHPGLSTEMIHETIQQKQFRVMWHEKESQDVKK